MDRDILNFREELLNEMALVDAGKVSRETLRSLSLYKIANEYYDNYIDRTSHKGIEDISHINAAHERSLYRLIKKQYFLRSLRSNGITEDISKYIESAIRSIFLICSGGSRYIVLLAPSNNMLRIAKNKKTIEDLLKFLKINLDSLGNSVKEEKIREAIKGSIDYLSFDKNSIKEAIDNKDTALLDSIVKYYKDDITIKDIKYIADRVLELKLEEPQTGKNLYYRNKAFYSSVKEIIKGEHIIELAKKDSKYIPLLTNKMYAKGIAFDKTKPEEVRSLDYVGTNKKIEVMKNAGIDKDEIDKLKPNTVKTKKEKKFGKGIVS